MSVIANASVLPSPYRYPYERDNLAANLALENWVREGYNFEKRVEAKSRIEKFLWDRTEYILDLSGLNLTELPDLFHYDTYRLRLHSFYLNDNSLSSLPPLIGCLSSLRTLEINNNRLTSLPASECMPRNLQFLALNENKLSTLDLDGAFMPMLEHLDLSYNQLISITTKIGNFPNLQALNLTGNLTLKSLTKAIFLLPDYCIISIEQTDLSYEFLNGLEELISMPNYRGPIHFFYR